MTLKLKTMVTRDLGIRISRSVGFRCSIVELPQIEACDFFGCLKSDAMAYVMAPACATSGRCMAVKQSDNTVVQSVRLFSTDMKHFDDFRANDHAIFSLVQSVDADEMALLLASVVLDGCVSTGGVSVVDFLNNGLR